MDVMLLREVVTVVSFLAFAGVVAYALLPGNGARFEKAARIPLDDDYLSELRTGQTIVAQVDPYPGEKFAGRVKTVGGVIDPATRTFFAEAEFPNSDGRLRPGLFARIELGAEESHAKTR